MTITILWTMGMTAMVVRARSAFGRGIFPALTTLLRAPFNCALQRWLPQAQSEARPQSLRRSRKRMCGMRRRSANRCRSASHSPTGPSSGRTFVDARKRPASIPCPGLSRARGVSSQLGLDLRPPPVPGVCARRRRSWTRPSTTSTRAGCPITPPLQQRPPATHRGTFAPSPACRANTSAR